jgi:DNA/RNA-binding domain of Phe-tRNA-synthetase-like protein
VTLTPFHQEMCIRDLNIEFAKLEPTESVESAQAATATSHKDWLDIQSVDVSVQKDRSKLFSSARAQKKKTLEHEESRKAWKARKSIEAFQKYYEQGESRKDGHKADLMQLF